MLMQIASFGTCTRVALRILVQFGVAYPFSAPPVVPGYETPPAPGRRRFGPTRSRVEIGVVGRRVEEGWTTFAYEVAIQSTISYKLQKF